MSIDKVGYKYSFINKKDNHMGIFSRKQKEVFVPQQEERQMSLGGLLYNSVSNFSSGMSMKLSAVYCATNQISNAVAMLPIQIVEQDNDEMRRIMHPLWNILNLCVDGKYNHFNVFKMAIESVILKGNAYFYIDRDTHLNVTALHYINADYVHPVLQDNGAVKYIVDGFPAAVDAVDMIHLWQHVDDTFNGISLIKYAYNALKGSNDAENSAAKFYRGGAGLNGVLKATGTLTNEQKQQIRESWNSAFSPEGNGIAVLPNGLDFQPVSVSPEDSQLLETREFNITEIARFFNISPIKLFQLDEVSYSSMESTQLYFLSDTISPYTTMIEEEFNRKLFRPSEIGRLGVMFDFTKALQTNKQAQAEYYRTLLTNGIMTVNEIRGELGLEKLTDPAGDKHYMQIAMGTIEDIAAGKYLKQNSQEQNVKNDNKVTGE